MSTPDVPQQRTSSPPIYSTQDLYPCGRCAGTTQDLPRSLLRAQFPSVTVSREKSPPTTMRCRPPWSFPWSLTAMELAPVEVLPWMTGRSVAWSRIKSRERGPPLTKQASSRSRARTFVPLEAKQPSPESAFGISRKGMSCQVSPPSKERVTKKRPFTGSPTTMPLLMFQNSIASMNIPRVLFRYTNFQVFPPSVVLRRSAGSAIAMTIAVFALKASMSRKSRFSYPGTVIQAQVAPPSSDLPTVPPLPLTQTILSLTALSPRREVWGRLARSLMLATGAGGWGRWAVGRGECAACAGYVGRWGSKAEG